MFSTRRAPVLALLLSTYLKLPAYAQSFLEQSSVPDDPIQNVLEHQPATRSFCPTVPKGPIEMTLCDYESIESVNGKLFGDLKELVKLPYFKYFQADLYRECPFWHESNMCMNANCGITWIDESEVPEKWRAKALSKIELPPADLRNQLPGCYYRDSDFCLLDDMTEGDYYDLSQIPERFTGYSGPSAHRIWSSIYDENCFGQSELNSQTGATAESPEGVLTDEGNQQGEAEVCLEKQVYYRIISGLHASISTHVCLEYLNQSTGEWGPNLPCFISRVASHPDRLKNIYFNTVLLLRAVARLGPYLSEYDYCSCKTGATHEDDASTLSKLNSVIDVAKKVGRFDERALFTGQDAKILREEFKSHFRNVSRIMDCVGCDKCRLWGKVQTTGVATALKVLFELDEKALDPKTNSNLLSRSEIVALINTLHRFTESLAAVDVFRGIWAETSDEESKKLVEDAEKEETASSTKSSPNTTASPPTSADLLQTVTFWAQQCGKSAAECADVVTAVWSRTLKKVSTFFKVSKKDGLSIENFDEL